MDLPVAGAFSGTEWVDCNTDGACGVSVRRDHNGGATDFSLDSFTPLSFDPATDPPVDPNEPIDPDPNDVEVTVSPSTDLVDGQTVTVTGADFVAGQGVYVQLCATPEGTPGTAAGRATSCYPEQDGDHVVWVTPIDASGTFSTPLTVAETFVDADEETVDCSVEGACGIFVRRDHNGGTADYSQDAFAPIAFGDGDPVVSDPAALSADRTTDLDPAGDTVTVTGDDYRPGDPVFVALCDAAVPNFAACDFANVAEVTPATADAARALGDPGSFEVELQVRAAFGDTDCTALTTCALQTWSVSGTNPDAEATVPVSFAAAASVTPTTVAPNPYATTPYSTTAATSLPRTGWSPWPFAASGLALVAGGALFVAEGRRRART